MARFSALLLILLASVNSMAEETPSMELLMFLADYTDEEGNWSGPGLEESSDELSDVKGEEE